jgi:hypothetical protein
MATASAGSVRRHASAALADRQTATRRVAVGFGSAAPLPSGALSGVRRQAGCAERMRSQAGAPASEPLRGAAAALGHGGVAASGAPSVCGVRRGRPPVSPCDEPLPRLERGAVATWAATRVRGRGVRRATSLRRRWSLRGGLCAQCSAWRSVVPIASGPPARRHCRGISRRPCPGSGCASGRRRA